MLGFIFVLIIFCFYLILFLTDIKYYLIPDIIVVPAIVFSFVYIILAYARDLISLYQNLMASELGPYLIEAGYFNDKLLFALKSFGIHIFSALLIAFFFWFLVFITKGKGMGDGDIRLGLLLGLFNGFPRNVLAVFLGFVIGASFSLILVFFKKKTIKDTIPFGPFLILGSVIAAVFGKPVITVVYGNLLEP